MTTHTMCLQPNILSRCTKLKLMWSETTKLIVFSFCWDCCVAFIVEDAACSAAELYCIILTDVSIILSTKNVNFQNKFKREERENSWRVDKAFRKY